MYSKAISWIDDCRIPFVDDVTLDAKQNQKTNKEWGGFHKKPIIMQMYKHEGRFPANILVSDDMLNDGVISKSGNNKIRSSDGFNKNAYGIGIGVKVGDNNGEYGDKGTNSRYYDIDKWFDKILDV